MFSHDVLRVIFATLVHLSPAGRARRQAALARFLGWVYRHELIAATPMARVNPRGRQRHGEPIGDFGEEPC
jgi:hypothetical protein